MIAFFEVIFDDVEFSITRWGRWHHTVTKDGDHQWEYIPEEEAWRKRESLIQTYRQIISMRNVVRCESV